MVKLKILLFFLLSMTLINTSSLSQITSEKQSITLEDLLGYIMYLKEVGEEIKIVDKRIVIDNSALKKQKGM